jgi:cytochrome c oxidase assembly protein Cox11
MVNIILELMITQVEMDWDKDNVANAEMDKLVTWEFTHQDQRLEMRDGNAKTAAFQITLIEMENVHHVTQE